MIRSRTIRNLILTTGFGAILCGAPAWASPETAFAADLEPIIRAPKPTATAVGQAHHVARRPAYTRVAYYPLCPGNYSVQMPLIVGIAW